MNKEEHLHIRISREEKAKAEALAERFQCPVSKVVVDAIAFAYEVPDWMEVFIRKQDSAIS